MKWKKDYAFVEKKRSWSIYVRQRRIWSKKWSYINIYLYLVVCKCISYRVSLVVERCQEEKKNAGLRAQWLCLDGRVVGASECASRTHEGAMEAMAAWPREYTRVLWLMADERQLRPLSRPLNPVRYFVGCTILAFFCVV